MAASEEEHWWFRARRRITESLLNRYNPPPHAAILDAGCGSGGNLALLSTYGKVHAFETYETARNLAKARGIGEVADGSLPGNIPFGEQAFDLITMFDVLEHIEDDAASLTALHARLVENGKLLLTVPACPLLWGKHDAMHHHFRRYTKRLLAERLEAAGFKVELCNYFNFWLFPLALAARLLDRLRGNDRASIGSATPPAPLNHLLYALMASERFLIPHIPLLFGVSLIAVASKK